MKAKPGKGPSVARPRPFIVQLVQFSALIARDRSTVQAWIRQGMPVLRPRGGRRGAHEIDLGPALQWVLAHAEAACEERLAAARSNPAAEAARTKKLSAEARIAEANARERESELVPAADVGHRWGRMILAARERLLALPATLVQRGLVAPADEHQVVKLAHDALDELAARGEPAVGGRR